jgi:hypothetical protein
VKKAPIDQSDCFRIRYPSIINHGRQFGKWDFNEFNFFIIIFLPNGIVGDFQKIKRLFKPRGALK